jgi:transposase
MSLYAAIDLHSDNSVAAVMDEEGRVVFRKRIANHPATGIVQALMPFREDMTAVAVESTPNWYWLERVLRQAEFKVELVNTAAVEQYGGLKYGDDFSDATHLADLMRMKRLPTAYICPEDQRAVRDLARKRAHLVRQRTAQLLSAHNLLARDLGQHIKGNELKALRAHEVNALALLPEQKMALKATLAVVKCLGSQIERLERELLRQVRSHAQFKPLKTISGVGDVLALTITLETGEIARFPSAGHYASYARLVSSARMSNGKKKGEGNTRCGNRYLAWAFAEAAHFAVRYDPQIKRWYQRKEASRGRVVALKAVAHKLARAAYHVMAQRSEFDPRKAFS